MLVALGKVTIDNAGTLKRATDNLVDPTAMFLCHSIMIEVWPSNNGKIYVCDRADADSTTGYGIVAILGVPTVNSIPTFTDTVTGAIAAINLEEIWLDAELDGEGAIVVGDRP
jgi:hypothetical protein